MKGEKISYLIGMNKDPTWKENKKIERVSYHDNYIKYIVANQADVLSMIVIPLITELAVISTIIVLPPLN